MGGNIFFLLRALSHYWGAFRSNTLCSIGSSGEFFYCGTFSKGISTLHVTWWHECLRPGPLSKFCLIRHVHTWALMDFPLGCNNSRIFALKAPQVWRQSWKHRIWHLSWNVATRKMQMGVSKNRGKPPKWMVYNGKPYQNGWFGGFSHIFGNTQVADLLACLSNLQSTFSRYQLWTQLRTPCQRRSNGPGCRQMG